MTKTSTRLLCSRAELSSKTMNFNNASLTPRGDFLLEVFRPNKELTMEERPESEVR
jgi:hypothetical protein